MNRIILNKKIIGVVLSITLLANAYKTLPLSSTIEMCARFAGKSLVAATIIGIASLPFFIKNKDKNSKTVKKQSLIKLLQIALLGGIGNTAFSHLSGKEKSSLEQNKGIELQPLPAKIDKDTKNISSSHPWYNLLGTAAFAGLGSLCTVVFSRLSSPFKKSKKHPMPEKKELNSSMHVLDAFITTMAEQTRKSGISLEEFSIRLACFIKKIESDFEPKFTKIVDNFCADINRLSPDDTQKLAIQIAAIGLKVKTLEKLKLEGLTSTVQELQVEIEGIKRKIPAEGQFFDAGNSES